MKRKYAVNGLFLTQKVTGIQRFAYEITKALDNLFGENELVIVVPAKSDINIRFTNIPVVKYGSLQGILWEQINYAYFLKKNKYKAVCLTNVLPLFYRKGIIAIHDVSYRANPHFFKGLRNRLSALWHCLNYYAAVHSQMKILTVSAFSKSEIQKYYKLESERIYIVYNAWQHMNDICPSSSLIERYPQLRQREFYFSMATMAPNKNVNWIVEAARQHREYMFVIAGSGRFSADMPSNVLFLGYVSDEEAKELMSTCKAFIFPTFYEGFGIPPLEAVACGASQIIVSDTPCMREVYGEFASYVNPYKPKEWIIEECKNKNLQELLANYSWRSSAKIVKQMMEDTDCCSRAAKV